MAAQTGQETLGEGRPPLGLRADIGLSDTFEEKRLKFIDRFPEGDFVQVDPEVLGALEKTASSEQIQAAMQTVVDMVKRARTREANQLLNDTDGDLVTDEGLRACANVLVKNGFTLESARDVIIDLQTRRGLR